MSYQTLIHHLLISHPSISSFQWAHHSSLPFLLSVVFTYLSLTLLLSAFPPKPANPSFLKLVSIIHNLNLLLLSALMSVGCILSSIHEMSKIPSSASYIICFPPSTASAGPAFFWAHVFYLSKVYELVDTLLILLSDPASRRRRLTFLHVYHHSVVVVMCYVWLETVQSTMLVALVTNASVHVVMYAYYLSASLGWRWGGRWKRFVTEVQICQFLFSFAVSAVFLYCHFRGKEEGCKGFKGWVFNAVFNVSLFMLFLDFHGKAYKEKRKEKKRLD